MFFNEIGGNNSVFFNEIGGNVELFRSQTLAFKFRAFALP
jgi:hypothetical protein